MGATIASPPVPSAARAVPAVAPAGPDARGTAGLVVIDPASWDLYEQLLAETAAQHLRITYDDGRMSLTSPLQPHEMLKTAIGRLIGSTTEELNIPCLPLGSTTWRRRSLRKGLEADECYYVQREAVVRSIERIDLDRDPPPDLAVEIDITHSPVSRPPIYAALGVNEVWRHDGERVEFLKRSADGTYDPIVRSEALPVLTSDVVNDWLAKLRPGASHTDVYRAFRRWLGSLPEAT